MYSNFKNITKMRAIIVFVEIRGTLSLIITDVHINFETCLKARNFVAII